MIVFEKYCEGEVLGIECMDEELGVISDVIGDE